jgi:glycosyltransferase involved in cell wall biosynthesis
MHPGGVVNEARARIARKNCAIVECYSRHDEVYLTTVSLLKKLGYDVTVFNVWRNRIKNSFVNAPGLKPRIRSSLSASAVLAAVRKERFDLVIFNTFEGSEVLSCARDILRHTPVLGFMHNGSMVCNLKEYEPYLSQPRFRLMVLAPYVGARFAHLAASNTVIPVFFFDRIVPSIPRSAARRRFCVQGYFDPRRRHYDQLLEALKALRDEGRSDFEVYVMGRSFDRRFRDFARQVREAGLASHVRYSWKGIGYRRYYRLLNSMDFVLPLISPDSHPTYFKSKSTSSVAAAVGFNAVPITHERLAEHYSLEDAAFTYTTDLLPALRRALDCNHDELSAMRVRLATLKERYLEDSLRELDEAIAMVGAGRASERSLPLDRGGAAVR